MRKCFSTLICLVLFSLAMIAQIPASGPYLIKAGKFYDAEKNVFLKDQEILVEGNSIKAVGSKLTIPKGTTVINLSNATVTPGLIDLHTHLLMSQRLEDNLAADVLLHSSEYRVLRAAGYAQSYLQSGFTAIRDLGNSGQYLDLEVAAAIRRGFIPGPRMFTSGPILSAMDGQFYQLPLKEQEKITHLEYRVINGVDDAVLAVKEHVNNQVDVIKMVAFGERMGLTLDEMKAIVKTAHEYGKKVTAHATTDNIITQALAAGVDGIEHGYYITDSTLEKMVRQGVYLVPTDVSLQGGIEREEAMHKKDHDTVELKKMLQPLTDRLTKARQKGVTIGAGSDAYFDLRISRGDDAKQTLAAYFEEGMPAADVLKTATWNAALILGRKNDIGVLRPGAKADIVVFNGDLETNFKKVLFDVRLVIKDGKVVHQ
ncbi:amidohydrolase family protein [Paraflavitalea soli]|nr:amidohydrolase family protein [Paraflavitalea soli]